jgi:lipopolysaccharide transport system ATP-binding protein
MHPVEFHHVSLHFAVFEAGARSLRKRLIQAATGGRFARDARGHVVVQALEDLTFSISEGERVGIVGRNGAGKTTLLGVLGRIYAPTSGSVRITGSIGSLINITLGTDPESTGRENILLRGAMLGIPRRDLLAQMDEMIEFSELGEFIDMPMRTYSTGMNMRLAFTVATIVRPDILLMDEWLSVGDKDFRAKAAQRIEAMRDASKVLIVATHSKELILTQCTRVLWLEQGRLKMDGPAAEVAAAYFGA